MNMERLQVELDQIVKVVQVKVDVAQASLRKAQEERTPEAAKAAVEAAREAKDSALGAIAHVQGFLREYVGM